MWASCTIWMFNFSRWSIGRILRERGKNRIIRADINNRLNAIWITSYDLENNFNKMKVWRVSNFKLTILWNWNWATLALILYCQWKYFLWKHPKTCWTGLSYSVIMIWLKCFVLLLQTKWKNSTGRDLYIHYIANDKVICPWKNFRMAFAELEAILQQQQQQRNSWPCFFPLNVNPIKG